jgi:hypothetical protein
MFGLVIVHDEARVNDAGHPAQQRQRGTQEETENAARHQNGNGRKDDAKEIAQRFQGVISPAVRIRSQLALPRHADRGICFLQGSSRVRFAGLSQIFLRVDALAGVGLGLGGLRLIIGAAGKKQTANGDKTESRMVNLHQFRFVFSDVFGRILQKINAAWKVNTTGRVSPGVSLMNEKQTDFSHSPGLGCSLSVELRHHRDNYDNDPHARAKLDVRAVGWSVPPSPRIRRGGRGSVVGVSRDGHSSLGSSSRSIISNLAGTVSKLRSTIGMKRCAR